MANLTLIMGESGTGKSTSLRNLDPAATFIINVLDKPLPFRGWKSSYNKENKNYYSSDNAEDILKVINTLNTSEKYSHIDTIIIDDFQYVMANSFMYRATEKGFDKFTQIAQSAWKIINESSKCRENLDIFVLSHTESRDDGRVKCKTIGKMIDDKITLEGMFTVVLHSMLKDDRYTFLTQFDGCHISKSPMGMFDDLYIENDMAFVKQKIKEYGE